MRRPLAGAVLLVLGLSLLALAFPGGAPVGRSGAPRDAGTCSQLRCHLNASLGSAVEITIEGEAGYRPGETRVVVVRVTDPHNIYGFQMTARRAVDSHAQSGSFSPASNATSVRCASTDLMVEQPKTAGSCPPGAPLEYIGHDNPQPSGTFRFFWQAPAEDVGTVVFYAAANAANGDSTNAGDRIHATQFRLSAAGPPAFAADSTTTASAYGIRSTLAPQAWIEIYGTRLARTIARWDAAISSGQAPVEVGGVRVTVGGRPAYLSYVSPDQINAQVPDGVPPGQAALTVATLEGQMTQSVAMSSASPGLWAPAEFRAASGRQFAAAQHPDGTFVGPPGSFGPAVASRSARPGDTITFWGTGFGAVSPPQPAGRVVRDSNTLASFTLRFGGQTVTVAYAGLAPGYVGLYQINAVVPPLEPGEYEVTGTVAEGIQLPPAVFINLR